MAAVLNRSETAFQAAIISGPPPLGPGAEPMERLLAFGRARIELNLLHRRLIDAAGRGGCAELRGRLVHRDARALPARRARRPRRRPVPGDGAVAPLEVPILEQQVEIEEMQDRRIMIGWEDLVTRVVNG